MTPVTLSMTTKLGQSIEIQAARSPRRNGSISVSLICKEKTCSRKCGLHFVIPKTLSSVSDAELAELLCSHCAEQVKREHAIIEKLYGLTGQE